MSMLRAQKREMKVNINVQNSKFGHWYLKMKTIHLLKYLKDSEAIRKKKCRVTFDEMKVKKYMFENTFNMQKKTQTRTQQS